MTDPRVTCFKCGRSRSCRKISGQGYFFPENVRKGMHRQCPVPGKPCDFQYRAGVDLAGLRQALRKEAPGE